MELLGERIGWSPFSPATLAGDQIFIGGVMPVDWRSGLLPATRPGPGHLLDPLRLQSEAALDVLSDVLKGAGRDLQSVSRLTQWFRGPDSWPFGDAWSGISISRYMEARTERFSASPASTAVAIRDLVASGALLCIDAVVAANGEVRVLPAPDEPGRPPFPSGAVAANRIYLSGRLPTNWRGEAGSAVHPDARLDETLWYKSPAREQTKLVLNGLARDAETAGTDLDHAVRANVFLADACDLVGFEEAWKEFFPHRPPARTIIPGTGLAARGCRVEVDLELVPPDVRVERVELSDLVSLSGHAPEAVRSGDLLHISGQMAVSESGIHPSGVVHTEFGVLCSPTAAQLRIALERIERICKEAGAALEDTAMLRIFMPDLPELGPALHILEEAFGVDRSAGTMIGVGQLPVADCRVLVDAVVHLA